ncbi:MAG: DUF1593 domain-containing protein [Arachnia sp.]
MTRGPRTIVTTDPELDDLNSVLRLLLYSNEIDLRGLVYTASRFHHAGNPAAGVEPHRWPADGSVLHIDQAVNAYDKAWPTLVRHDPAYPEPARLRALIRHGNVDVVGDMSADTPGSDLVREILLDDEPGQVFLQVWGGHNTIARALKTIEEQHRGTPEWEAVRAKVSAKAVITSFGQQDDTFADYIAPAWPGIESREVATTVWGYFARNVVAEADQHLLTPEWTRTHVSEVGPLGAEYRVWGDGKQMAAGFDSEDYFGLTGLTADELTARGYWVWMPVQEPGGWLSEGDSSNFALLVDNGLRSWEHPTWGGWGGRQAADPRFPSAWSNAGVRDTGDDGEPREDWAAARWFDAVQRDFAARLRWTVEQDYAAANHHPRVRVEEGLFLRRRPGDGVALHAVADDPDGDDVSLTWWQYREAGTGPHALALETDGPAVSFRVPQEALPGETLHLIIEATDDGSPALTTYQRVVIEVDGP